MAASRSERLMKLLIMLLVQRQFVSKDRIREEIYPGDEPGEAFERKFERDKDELRSLGVPVESGTLDAYFEDTQGYRVRPDDFELPEIHLTSAEAAVLRVATQVWQTTRLAEAARDGVRKLAAGGAPVALEGDASDLGVAVPTVVATEESFDVFVEATHTRTEVVFDYQGTRDAVPRRRRLQPWGVVRHGGRWYAVGADPEVSEGDPQRVFRLTRVSGNVRADGRRDAFVPPADVDVQDIARRVAPPARSGGPATLLVRAGAGFEIRRDAVTLEPGVPGPDTVTAWDRIHLPWSGHEVARTVLAHGCDVVVEGPDELRTQVVSALRTLVGGPMSAQSNPTRPATAGAREQVGRMLALVPYLNARGSVHVDEAARDLGVSAAQITKDLRVLFLCGLPGGMPDDLIDVDIHALVEAGGDRMIRMSNADYLNRPLRLSPTEASALMVALRTLADGTLDPATRNSVESALAKLEAALGTEAARIDTGSTSPREAETEATWNLLESAIADGTQVRITYHVPARDELVERTIDPWSLSRSSGAAYIEAWCHLAGDVRSFRLDRIHDATRLTSTIAHPAPDEAEGAAEATTGLVVTLRLGPQARWVPDYYRTEAVRPLADGGVEVDMWVADPRWLNRFVLRLAPDVTVLAPADAMPAAVRRATETLGLYDEASRTMTDAVGETVGAVENPVRHK